MKKPILEVEDLSVFYGKKRNRRAVISDVSFAIHEGETVGLIGSSGAGKSSIARAILELEGDVTGTVRHHTNRPQIIFQDPHSSLNPRMTVANLVEEPLVIAKVQDKTKRRAQVVEMLEQVGLDARYLSRYPRELSGGQRQRVAIAAALIARPKLLIADEPLSAVDSEMQEQIVELLGKLQRDMGLSMLLIAHDLQLVERICDRVVRV